MKLPLSFFDVSVFLAANTIILLATSEVLSSSHGRVFQVDKRIFNIIATFLGILFGVFVTYSIYEALLTLPLKWIAA